MPKRAADLILWALSNFEPLISEGFVFANEGDVEEWRGGHDTLPTDADMREARAIAESLAGEVPTDLVGFARGWVSEFGERADAESWEPIPPADACEAIYGAVDTLRAILARIDGEGGEHGAE